MPIGKGLSSSASLEVAVARALRDAFHLELTDLEIAMMCHRAETVFVGAPVGIMDQMVCSLGDRQHALFLDTATLAVEKIPLPRRAEIGVIDSGLSPPARERRIPNPSARVRRRRGPAEGSVAARSRPWTICRDSRELPPPLNRRARHVVTENARVLAAVDAPGASDPATLGQLFLESHASMRDDFEISLPEIDRLVDIAAGDADVFGARLTGGGFGGAVVMLCAEGFARSVTASNRCEVPHGHCMLTARRLVP